MMSTTDTVAIPARARLLLARAAVQTIARREHVDVLHIKGDAVDASLRVPGTIHSPGTDVDAMVRPSQIGRLDTALRRHGWQVYSTFRNGSPFGHAQTYLHDTWGYLDLHRSFPGIELDEADAFRVLWQHRSVAVIAGVECAVPSVPAQSLIRLLNAARAPYRGNSEVARAWASVEPDERREIEELADELEAHVALAAATGRIEEFRGHRSYRLWRAVSQGGSRSEEWWGRLRAARTWQERTRLAARLPLVNTEHLSIRLGHRPAGREVLKEFFDRPVRAVRERAALRRARSRT